MKKPVAIYPGTFDPITYGHIDVVERATELFSKVIVVVARNSSKRPLFSDDERIEMIHEVFGDNPQVEVDGMQGLLVEYVKQKDASVIIRGLRAVSDFEYEFQMALTNRSLAPTIDTIFLMPDVKYTYLNSSIVREVARHGGDLSSFVPQNVQLRLMEKVKVLSKSAR